MHLRSWERCTPFWEVFSYLFYWERADIWQKSGLGKTLRYILNYILLENRKREVFKILEHLVYIPDVILSTHGQMRLCQHGT